MSKTPGRNRPRTFTRVDAAVPAAVPRARTAVLQFARAAGAAGETLESVALAFSEAITNAVLHAYPEPPGKVYCSAWVSDGRLEIHVADDGHGLRPGSGNAGLGLGLALIAQVCDGFQVAVRASGGTEVQMSFELL